jgi:phage gpG-like protein
MSNMSQLSPDMQQRAQQVAQAINDRLPRLIGDMLVDAFRRSWQLQRFNDTGSQPWQQVKRRTEGSPWYGFNYKSNSRVPVGSRGTTAKGKIRKFGSKGGITNYTATATTRNILHGWGSAALRDSIFVAQAGGGRVIVATDKPYAKVHNEGGKIRIFGKGTATMPKRQFMGKSQVAEGEAKRMIKKTIDKIMTS